MNQQLYRGDSVIVSKTGTFIDLSDLLLDSPKKVNLKNLKAFYIKKYLNL